MLLVGAVAVMFDNPWLFPSLGPTAAIMMLHPRQPASRPWNTLVGHGVGVLAGVLAANIFGATELGGALPGAPEPAHAMAAAAATALTLIGGHLLRADHPPAVATTLILALGAIPPDAGGALSVGVGVLLTCVAGAPLRALALRQAEHRDE